MPGRLVRSSPGIFFRYRSDLFRELRFVLGTYLFDGLLESDESATQYPVAFVEHSRLTGGDGRSLLLEADQQLPVLQQNHLARNRPAAVADAYSQVLTTEQLVQTGHVIVLYQHCLLYTSDAADE